MYPTEITIPPLIFTGNLGGIRDGIAEVNKFISPITVLHVSGDQIIRNNGNFIEFQNKKDAYFMFNTFKVNVSAGKHILNICNTSWCFLTLFHNEDEGLSITYNLYPIETTRFVIQQPFYCKIDNTLCMHHTGTVIPVDDFSHPLSYITIRGFYKPVYKNTYGYWLVDISTPVPPNPQDIYDIYRYTSIHDPEMNQYTIATSSSSHGVVSVAEDKIEEFKKWLLEKHNFVSRDISHTHAREEVLQKEDVIDEQKRNSVREQLKPYQEQLDSGLFKLYRKEEYMRKQENIYIESKIEVDILFESKIKRCVDLFILLL